MAAPSDTAGLREMLASKVPPSWRAGIISGDNNDWGHIRPSEALKAMEAVRDAMLDEIDTLRARVEELEGGLRGIRLLLPSYLRYAARTTLQGTKP